MHLQKISENAIQTLQEIHRSVMSDQNKAEVEQRLIELAQQAFLLRTNGEASEIGRLAANALETHRLQCKLSAMTFYGQGSTHAVVQH